MPGCNRQAWFNRHERRAARAIRCGRDPGPGAQAAALANAALAVTGASDAATGKPVGRDDAVFAYITAVTTEALNIVLERLNAEAA
jgi:hypothetical protein